MIKLTREDNSWLKCMRISKTSTNDKKLRAIEVFSKRKDISSDRKLAVTQAILDGEWEVEEPLYYVRNNKGVALLRKLKGEIVASQPFDRFFTDNNEDFQLTEHEVASYDPRYLEFLEEVE